MTEQLELALDILLPELPDVRDSCVVTALIWQALHWLGYVHAHHLQN